MLIQLFQLHLYVVGSGHNQLEYKLDLWYSIACNHGHDLVLWKMQNNHAGVLDPHDYDPEPDRPLSPKPCHHFHPSGRLQWS